MTQSLTNELTGKSAIQTDHDGFTFTDLAVLILDAVLFIYTAYRSYHFLTDSVPDDMQIMALVGLWGLDIGMIIWSLVWMFGSTDKYQDWTAMAFFIIDLIGVVLTSLTDSLLFSDPDGSMTAMLQGIAAPAIPLIVVANVIAGFIYHMTSPQTRARREARKAAAEHRRKMEEVSAMERDLAYAENYIMAKQETLDKAQILAEIKVAQDALEQATRAKLRDQVGIHNSASAIKADDKKQGREVTALAEKLNGLKAALQNLGKDQSEVPATAAAPVPASTTTPIPAPVQTPNPAPSLSPAPLPQSTTAESDFIELNYTPFIARLACRFPSHNIAPGDHLEAALLPDGEHYFVRVAGKDEPFARITFHDLVRLASGQSEDMNTSSLHPAPIAVRPNGNGATPSPT